MAGPRKWLLVDERGEAAIVEVQTTFYVRCIVAICAGSMFRSS